MVYKSIWLVTNLRTTLLTNSPCRYHPGTAGDGKSKAKQLAREKKPDRVDKSVAYTQAKKPTYADKAKGKKPEPLPDPPTKLFAQHWAVELMTTGDVANRVHVPQAGEHITFGISVLLTLERLPLFSIRNQTLTRAWKSGLQQEHSVDRPGTQSCMWSSLEKHEPPQRGKLKRSPTSCVLQAFVFTPHIEEEQWTRTLKNFYRTFPDLLRKAGVEAKVIDIFRLAWIGDGNSRAIRANIRVLETDRDLFLGCSGLGGLLIKSFDDQHQVGSVQWIRKDENETGAQYMQRARRHAERDPTKASLAFASSGSLGLRWSAGVVPSVWRLEGSLPMGGLATVQADWTRVCQLDRVCLFLPCLIYEVPVENSSAKDKSPVLRSSASSALPSGDATAQARQRGDDGVAIPAEAILVEADEVDVEEEQGSALRQFLAAHGLITHDVPKHACCLFSLCSVPHETREASRTMLCGMWLLTL